MAGKKTTPKTKDENLNLDPEAGPGDIPQEILEASQKEGENNE